MQPLSIDTESFELIRTAKVPKQYVDKTAYLRRPVSERHHFSFGNLCDGNAR